jgi:lipopolysaccharide/colanic/teichoic acid biosynthesis glycosyltransferase
MDSLVNKNDLVVRPKLKRIFDLLFSLLFIIITLPLTILILLAIFLEHLFRGQWSAPLFYTETRISQGQPFRLVKFNIFKPEVIATLRKQGIFIHTKNLEHDGQSLTGMGKILERVYLDEMPQFFNIFRGDLSVVGPRAVNLEVYQKIILTQAINTKGIIKAGLTGPAQSTKGITSDSHYDLENEYIYFCRTHSPCQILWLDCKIILRTLRVVWQAKGI